MKSISISKTSINFAVALSLALASSQVMAQAHDDNFDSLLSSARQGAMDAQARLAEMYSCKNSIGHNESRSYNGQGLSSISESRRRELDALVKIGEMYVELLNLPYDGRDEIGNPFLAFECTARASELGSAIAQAFWAREYRNGNSLFPRSLEESLRLARLSAGKGNADGQFWMGVAYFDGEGVPQNFNEALKWFRLAAEQGHEAAREMLGAFR